MATQKKTAPTGDHDRVAMLSVRADGTLDQHNPEIIGDLDAAKAATVEQFRQQAVSAADTAERGVTAGSAVADSDTQDPTVEQLAKAHDAAASSAESQAASVVDALGTTDSALKVSTSGGAS